MKPFPRKGAFAVIDNQVGILHIDTRVNRKTGQTLDRKEFHVIDSRGETKAVVSGWEGARIAKRSEIPPRRLVGLKDEQIASLGYV